MSYIHKGLQPVEFYKNPINPDATDWVYFTYEDWLRADENIITSSATVQGCELVTDSVHVGTILDDEGVEHIHVYAVQITPSANSQNAVVTHRITTQTMGYVVNLGRFDIEHTVSIPVEVL